MTDTQAELREKVAKAIWWHMDGAGLWTDSLKAADAILALLPPAPAVGEALEALKFYADPDTYFAIAFMGDRPCGEFADDLSEDDWTRECDFDRPMPGKRARKALAALGEGGAHET